MAVILMGFEIVKTSIAKIISKESAEFTWLSIAILAVSILVKLWMAYFNCRFAAKISITETGTFISEHSS